MRRLYAGFTASAAPVADSFPHRAAVLGKMKSLTLAPRCGLHAHRALPGFARRFCLGLWMAGSIAVSSTAVAVVVMNHGKPAGPEAADLELEAVLTGPSGSALGDSQTTDRLGERVAVAGDTLLVAAPNDDVANAHRGGSVYVFRRDGGGWRQEAKLVARDPQRLANFGRALAWDGQRAVVGAPQADGGRGKIYVFERSGESWTEQASIQAPTPAGMSVRAFGEAVALSAERVMVGANLSANGSSSSGSAHSLVLSNGKWLLEATLVAPSNNSYLQFGSSVALDGEHAIIGSASSGAGAAEATAHAFRRESDGGWTANGTLQPATGVPVQGLYAAAIAMSSDLAVVGVPRAGAAYVFVRDGSAWLPAARLTGQPGFGNALALSGNRLLVGALLDDAGNFEASAVLFEQADGGWVERQSWNGGVQGWLDGFGTAVTLDMGTAVIGSPGGNSDNGGPRGEAQVFEHSSSGWSLGEVLRVNPGPQANFGAAVVIAGRTAMIGSPGDEVDGRRAQGSVRWMERVGMRWRERGQITADVAWDLQLFGISVALAACRT